MKQDITGVIENWQPIKHPSHLSGISSTHIYGDIYDDIKGRFPDGGWILTTAVLNSDEIKEGGVIQTRNSVYKLGKMREKLNVQFF